MKKVDEFDWEWTKRKVMVIMPYYGNRLRQMSYALDGIRTEMDDSEWGVIVGDDGCGHDISSVEKIKNVKVVKVRSYPATERNGCICRNVLIKHCLSEWIISVDPEIHWDGDFFSTIYKHPNHVIRTGNARNVSVHSIESVLSGKIGINEIDYKVFHDYTPNDPVNENSVVKINPSNWKLMGTWGVHYGLALPRQAWHALRGYNEKMIHYGPDDGDMMERILKMMDNSLMRTIMVGKRGREFEVNLMENEQFRSDVENTKGLITNWLIASNVSATHLYHDRLTGALDWFREERAMPGFIRNRDIEWGMSYEK